MQTAMGNGNLRRRRLRRTLDSASYEVPVQAEVIFLDEGDNKTLPLKVH